VLFVLVALTAVSALIVHQASAQAVSTSSQARFSAAGQTLLYQADPAGQCYGEDINLTSGDILVRSHGVVDQNGFHGTFDVVRQGVKGIGAQTGDQYEEVGTDTISQGLNSAFTSSMTDHINIVGQGPDNNAVLTSTFVVTVNANGDVTAMVQHYTLTCH
jgi:hypothetical protein